MLDSVRYRFIFRLIIWFLCDKIFVMSKILDVTILINSLFLILFY